MAQRHDCAVSYFLKQDHYTVRTNSWFREYADRCVRYDEFFGDSNLLFFFLSHVSENKARADSESYWFSASIERALEFWPSPAFGTFTSLSEFLCVSSIM
jgi:hypothetical protein